MDDKGITRDNPVRLEVHHAPAPPSTACQHETLDWENRCVKCGTFVTNTPSTANVPTHCPECLSDNPVTRKTDFDNLICKSAADQQENAELKTLVQQLNQQIEIRNNGIGELSQRIKELETALESWENYCPTESELDNWSFQHFDFLDQSEKQALKIMSDTAKRAEAAESEVQRLREALEKECYPYAARTALAKGQ